ncbi:hypothetical protein HPB51_023353 [Rhipicephalus microplus]|uniref:Uncharacterized protein n=1 Tax=Rhipicephalus microplus TaxID=6941 RepID=A0A9J6EJR2_RHIMP|nr:hypothetical protein HPB51_023353 [Rhipicephalus microplus]
MEHETDPTATSPSASATPASSTATPPQAPPQPTDKFSFIIKFSSDTQRVLQYQPNLSIVEAFGYFGGYIGIWLGFSLLSVLLNLEVQMANVFAKRMLMQKVKAAEDTVMVFRLKQRF